MTVIFADMRHEDDCRPMARDHTVELSAVDLRASAAQRLASLGEMTSGVVHDLVNALSIIDVGLQLAELNAGAPDTVQRCIAKARHGVDHGLRLVATLIAFAKQQQVEPHIEDANDLLKDFEVCLRHGAGPAVRLAMDLGTDVPKCMVDATQFQAAILNLVVNARDAAPNGGEVVISTARYVSRSASTGRGGTGTFLRVSVTDNGDGIDEKLAPKIFDPFFTTKGELGTGLGLPQVCALMRQARGYIRVSSSPATGTRFDLFFPAVEVDQDQGPLAEGAAARKAITLPETAGYTSVLRTDGRVRNPVRAGMSTDSSALAECTT
jgi:signal transduction histidine kinase